MSMIMTPVVGLTRWWVRLYTRGLPPEVRDARRAEIESDLWEQGEDAGANGSEPDETALQVFGRLLLGMPADLSWRLEQRGARRQARDRSISGRRGSVMQTVIQKGLLGLTVLVAGLYIFPSLTVLFGGGEFDSTAGRVLFGLAGVLAGATILVGLLITKRSPWLGAGLLTVGAVFMAAFWFWMFFILIPLTIVVIAFAVFRARRFSREREAAA